MPEKTRIVKASVIPRTVVTAAGDMLKVPKDWALLKPGDAAVTRKVKAAGPSWTMQEKRGRKTFSKGVWAPQVNIEAAEAAVKAQRADPAHQRKLDQSRARRAAQEEVYRADFKHAVYKILQFDKRYDAIAQHLSGLITDHATPVGSGTVARTQRITIEERGRAAITAWMRHQTSDYDRMDVARVKGARREVRKKIARQSQAILDKYRRGYDIDWDTCPLAHAVGKTLAAKTPPSRR